MSNNLLSLHGSPWLGRDLFFDLRSVGMASGIFTFMQRTLCLWTCWGQYWCSSFWTSGCCFDHWCGLRSRCPLGLPLFFNRWIYPDHGMRTTNRRGSTVNRAKSWNLRSLGRRGSNTGAIAVLSSFNTAGVYVVRSNKAFPPAISCCRRSTT